MASSVAISEAKALLRDSASEDRWIWASAALIGTAILWLYMGILTSLWTDWMNDAGASYGILVPPIALYFAYLSRRRILACPSSIDLRGCLLTLLACVLYLVGRLGADYFTTRFSFLVLLTGLIWTFWGPRRVHALAFPLILLITAIPLPLLIYNRMAIPLQLLASDISANIVRLCGESVYQNGNILQLPNATLGVAEACSGLHCMTSLVVASLILGIAECTRVWSRLALLAISIPLAIAVNVFRVAGTALVANYDEQYAMGFYHSFSGWLVFVAGFGILWLFARGLRALARSRNGAAA